MGYRVNIKHLTKTNCIKVANRLSVHTGEITSNRQMRWSG